MISRSVSGRTSRVLGEEQRHDRRLDRFALARQVHADEQPRLAALRRRDLDAPAPRVAQEIAQAGLVGQANRRALQQRGFVLRRLVIDAEHLPAGRDCGEALQHVVHLFLAERQGDRITRRLSVPGEKPDPVLVQRHLYNGQPGHESSSKARRHGRPASFYPKTSNLARPFDVSIDQGAHRVNRLPGDASGDGATSAFWERRYRANRHHEI